MDKDFNLIPQSQISSAKQLHEQNKKIEQIKAQRIAHTKALQKKDMEKEQLEEFRYQKSIQISERSTRISIFSAAIAVLALIVAIVGILK